MSLPRAGVHLVRAGMVLGGLVLVVLAVGATFGPVGLLVAAVLLVAVGGYVWLRGPAMAMRSMHAYPVGEAEQPVLCRVVREVSTRSRVPVPRVYVSPTRAANALATGRDPSRAAICLTQGALDRLDERELRAVVGHELAHIRHRDTALACAAGALTRLAMAVPPVGLIMAGVARLAMSPQREFDADRESVRVVGDPLALARALRTFDAAARELSLPPEPGVIAANHLMITSPLRSRGAWRLLRSHPSTAERIARLERLAGYRR